MIKNKRPALTAMGGTFLSANRLPSRKETGTAKKAGNLLQIIIETSLNKHNVRGKPDGRRDHHQ